MKYHLTSKDRLVALRIVAIYAFVSGLWIYLSDSLLGNLFRNPAVIIRYSMLKGILSISVTVCLIYYLIARYIRQSRQAEEALKSLNEELETRVAKRTEELERQNKDLQNSYRRLEEETAKRVQAVEELRIKDRLMIQQSRMAAMGEMLGNIAHQWRQPLNLLGLKAQQIGLSFESGGFSKELLESNIDEIMAIVTNLSQTIDEFRNLATPDLEKHRFSVNEVVRKTVSLVQESFKEQHIIMDVETTGEMAVNGYPNDFAQALLNILSNARDALLERKTHNARITVRSWAENGRSVVTITDNAGGIKEEIMDKIFDPYFTTKELGKGTGVGLFMSNTIIEKNMGGCLTVRNFADCAEFRIEV